MTEVEVLLQRIADYCSGYTCGFSDRENGRPYRDKDAAALFFNVEGVPDISAEPMGEK